MYKKFSSRNSNMTGGKKAKPPTLAQKFEDKQKHKLATPDDPNFDWFLHNLYDLGIGRILTRSQTTFARIENSESDTKLFANRRRHHPYGKPHLLEVMKGGRFGALPRTIITRSMAAAYELDQGIMQTLDEYKNLPYDDPSNPKDDDPSLLDPKEEPEVKTESSGNEDPDEVLSSDEGFAPNRYAGCFGIRSKKKPETPNKVTKQDDNSK